MAEWWHACSPRRAAEVRERGSFPADYSANRSLYGPGVYLTSDAKREVQFGGAKIPIEAEGRFFAGGPWLLGPNGMETKIKAAGLYDEWHKEYLDLARKYFGGSDNNAQALAIVLKRHGYDGIDIPHGPHTWRLVFDPTKARYDASRELAKTADFDEAEHPRGGYSENRGEFSPASGTSSAPVRHPNTPPAWDDVHQGPGRPDGTGTLRDPIDVGNNLDRAVLLIAQGKHIRLDQPDEVSTLCHRIYDLAQKAKARGKKMPIFDLCYVSVPGTNIFCHDTLGIPRTQMPQLGGVPLPGSPAAKQYGEGKFVNLAQDFINALQAKGISVTQTTKEADRLRATQGELNGAKVSDMAEKVRAGTPEVTMGIFVTRDGYILDGHHTWAAQIVNDGRDNHFGDVPVRVSMIDTDIGTALDFANAYSAHMGIPQRGVDDAKVAALLRIIARNRTSELWGTKSLDALFPDKAPQAPLPFERAGRLKTEPAFDRSLVDAAVRDPNKQLVHFDPRQLHHTLQAMVTRQGVEYYLGGEYERSGKTFADQDQVGNHFPVIWVRPNGQQVILSGHHRAVAALLKGEPLVGIRVDAAHVRNHAHLVPWRSAEPQQGLHRAHGRRSRAGHQPRRSGRAASRQVGHGDRDVDPSRGGRDHEDASGGVRQRRVASTYTVEVEWAPYRTEGFGVDLSQATKRYVTVEADNDNQATLEAAQMVASTGEGWGEDATNPINTRGKGMVTRTTIMRMEAKVASAQSDYWDRALKHKTFWHITSDPHFTPSATFRPMKQDPFGVSQANDPRLYVTSDLAYWHDTIGWGLDRGYAAEIDMSNTTPEDRWHNTSFEYMQRPEVLVKDPSKVRVKRVIPLAQAYKESTGYDMSTEAKVAMPMNLPDGITYKVTDNGDWKAIDAHLGPADIIGTIMWNTADDMFDMGRGEIEHVEVHEKYRRRGLASELLRRAREIDPSVHHSDNLTSDGRDWSRKVAEWLPTKGMFSSGKPTLDPRVFVGDQIRPEIRDSVMNALSAFWDPRYPNWRTWAKVYLAGSGASHWWDTDKDMDILIGVDIDKLRTDRPANREVDEDDIVAHLDHELKTELDPTTTTLNGFETTYFVNPGAYDIRDIKPYAAYSLSDDAWVVRPPKLAPTWGPENFPHELWMECEQVAREAETVLSIPDPDDRHQACVSLFDWLHAGRQQAYSPHGTGIFDYGDVVWQYLGQHPDRLLPRLYEEKHDPAFEKTAAYGTDLIARGLVLELHDNEESYAKKMSNGTLTAQDMLHLLTRDGHLGVWWGVMGDYGDLGDFEDHASHGQGSLDDDVTVRAMEEEGRVGEDFIGGQCSVVIVAKRPMRGGEPWDPERHNPINPLMGNSYVEDGEAIELVEFRYNAGWGWKSLNANGLRAHAVAGDVWNLDGLKIEEINRDGKNQLKVSDQHGYLVGYYDDINQLTDVIMRRSAAGVAPGSPFEFLNDLEKAHDRYRRTGAEVLYRGYALPSEQVQGKTAEEVVAVLKAGRAARPAIVGDTDRPGLGKSWTPDRKIAAEYAVNRNLYDAADAVGVLITVEFKQAAQRRGYQPAEFVVLDGFQHERERYLDAQEDVEVVRVEAWTGDGWRELPQGGPIRATAGANGDELRFEESMISKPPLRTIYAYQGGERVGELAWRDDIGTIIAVQVYPKHQRQGVATALFNYVKSIQPLLHHSTNLTDDARAWIKGMDKEGGPVRDRITPAMRRMIPDRLLREPRPVVLDRGAEEDLAKLPGGVRNALVEAVHKLEDGQAEVEAKVGRLAGAFSVRLSNAWRALLYVGQDLFWHLFSVTDHDYAEVQRRFGAASGQLPPGYEMEVHEQTKWGSTPYVTVLVKHEGEPVAGLGVYKHRHPHPKNPGQAWYVDKIEVYPKHQRKGIATAMYDELHRRFPGEPVMHSLGPAQSDEARRLNQTLKDKYGPSMHLGGQYENRFFPAAGGGKYHRINRVTETAQCRATILLDTSATPITVDANQERVHPIVCTRCLALGRKASIPMQRTALEIKVDDHSPLPYDNRYRPNERISLIDGSGHHPDADLDKAREKQQASYEKWRANNPRRPRRDSHKPENASTWVSPGFGYFTKDNTDPGTVAFVDLEVSSSVVEIAYMAVRPDQRRKGLARQLIEEVYRRHPGKRVNWGKMMQAEIGHLYEDMQKSHPDQTGSASVYY